MVLEGEGKLLDICRLTCLEQGLRPLSDHKKNDVPALRVQGLKIVLKSPYGPGERGLDRKLVWPDAFWSKQFPTLKEKSA